eukprot:4877369-Pyramimonas_sp.AAC.1
MKSCTFTKTGVDTPRPCQNAIRALSLIPYACSNFVKQTAFLLHHAAHLDSSNTRPRQTTTRLAPAARAHAAPRRGPP